VDMQRFVLIWTHLLGSRRNPLTCRLVPVAVRSAGVAMGRRLEAAVPNVSDRGVLGCVRLSAPIRLRSVKHRSQALEYGRMA